MMITFKRKLLFKELVNWWVKLELVSHVMNCPTLGSLRSRQKKKKDLHLWLRENFIFLFGSTHFQFRHKYKKNGRDTINMSINKTFFLQLLTQNVHNSRCALQITYWSLLYKDILHGHLTSPK